MQTTLKQEIKNKLWAIRIKEKSDIKGRMLSYLGISIGVSIESYNNLMEVRDRKPAGLQSIDNIDLEIIFSRSFILELWTIRSLLKKIAPNEVQSFDNVYPKVKYFRDALAHIEERAEEKIKVNREFKDVKWEKIEAAGGLLTSNDGGSSWVGKQKRMLFNVHISGGKGLYTSFGIIDDWFITSTDEGIVDIEISDAVFNNYILFIRGLTEII